MKFAFGSVLALGAALLLGAPRPAWPQQNPPADQARQPAPDQTSLTVDVIGHLFSEDERNLEPYWPSLEKKTKDTWLSILPAEAQPPESAPGTVRILCVVHTDGRITNMVLEQKSGKAQLDRAAWAAITRSAPYDAFPYGISTDHVRVRFTFLYNGGTVVTPTVDGVRKKPGM